SPAALRATTSPRTAGRGEGSKIHKPALDEMGIALYHEVAPHRPGSNRDTPRKPNLDEMGPGIESIPGKRESSSPRSTLGRPGMRGGWKPRKR
ncbi:MAG TPA: hypothetical protein VIJ04_01770, partial [Xanthobacteraceae bacterium]